jgi:hypothetical protein
LRFHRGMTVGLGEWPRSPGAIPYNRLSSARIDGPKGSVPARDVLTSIAESADTQLMWDLLYDYESRSYFLSLRPTIVIRADEAGGYSIVPK